MVNSPADSVCRRGLIICKGGVGGELGWVGRVVSHNSTVELMKDGAPGVAAESPQQIHAALQNRDLTVRVTTAECASAVAGPVVAAVTATW